MGDGSNVRRKKTTGWTPMRLWAARGMLTIQIGMFHFHALPNKEVIRHSQISANHTLTMQKSRQVKGKRIL